MATRILTAARWLKQPLLWVGTVGEAVFAGWLALHYAALLGDRAAIHKKRPLLVEGAFVRWGHYHRRTGRIAVPITARHVRSGAPVSVDELGEQVGTALLSVLSPATRDRALTRDVFRAVVQGLVEPARRPAPLEFDSPYSLLRSSYHSFQYRGTSNPFAPLLTVAIAARGIALVERCELCFRWAIPGYRFCHQHSQSSLAPGSPSERFVRYRLGRRVSDEFKYPPREPPLPARRPAQRLPRLIARLLWGTPLPDEERTARAIRRALERNPAVLDTVGSDAMRLRTGRLFERLAERLDPYEINPAAWVWVIGRAARWKRIERRLNEATHPMRPETRLCISVATEKAKEGLTRAEIAELIGVRRSAISNWIRRGVAPDLAAALAAHPNGRAKPRR